MAAAVALAKQYSQVIKAIISATSAAARRDGLRTSRQRHSSVKRRSVLVTYAMSGVLLRNREVYDAVDFVTIHILPIEISRSAAQAPACDAIGPYSQAFRKI